MTDPRENLFAIVLAAGRSVRFGRVKQLAVVEDQPLVARALDRAESVCGPRTVIVLGHAWQDVYRACNPFAGFAVINDDYASGMASSIAAGIRALPATASGALLLLADQPRIRTDDLEELASRWSTGSGIACSRSQSGLSPPVIFAARYFHELVGIRGDRGAHSIIERHREDVDAVDMPAAAFDVDVAADLERWEDSAPQ